MTAVRHRQGADREPIHAALGRRTVVFRSNIRHGRRHDAMSTAPDHSPGRKSSYGARS